MISAVFVLRRLQLGIGLLLLLLLFPVTVVVEGGRRQVWTSRAVTEGRPVDCEVRAGLQWTLLLTLRYDRNFQIHLITHE